MEGIQHSILVIGGGIAGMTAAVEAAEVGHRVILVEKEAYLGGRVLRSARYFPKMCPPTCGYEINTRRIRQNPRITVHTQTTVESIRGEPGDFTVRVCKRPRYVTGAGELDESILGRLACEREDDFNLGLTRTRALYRPHPSAYPPQFVLDRAALSEEDEALLREACPAEALDLDMEEQHLRLKAAAIIVATGWRPYNAARLTHLGFGTCPNVVTNVILERLADRGGPTGGHILRPSDGKPPLSVAFVQCAGSRDEDHLPYCSAVCCMATLKQVRYMREQHPDCHVTVFYIDIRTVGRHEKFYFDLLADDHVGFIKGKVATVETAAGGDDLILDVEDTIDGENHHARCDLVVLATGIVPNTADLPLPGGLEYDQYGFVAGPTPAGIFAAGCVQHPCDVSSASREGTAAALRAIQCVDGGG
jgi:quinone-modifying oxidoreductase subunit QmoA